MNKKSCDCLSFERLLPIVWIFIAGKFIFFKSFKQKFVTSYRFQKFVDKNLERGLFNLESPLPLLYGTTFLLEKLSHKNSNKSF